MPLQIAKPAVVGKMERLAKATGVSKTAAVENAFDRLLGDLADVNDGAARGGAAGADRPHPRAERGFRSPRLG